MNRATPETRKLAARLIALEKSVNKPADRKLVPTFDATDRLRPQLATLMGNGGFRSLMARSLALGGEEVPWLHAIHVKADGSLEGLADIHGRLKTGEFLEGRVVLLAQLFGLMVAFIGETLTLRLVREVWPKVPLDDLDFSRNGVTT